ncbi:DNA adenine methylase [Luteimonas sp. A478]
MTTQPSRATSNNFPRAKPFLRWAGSKRLMLPTLRGFLPDEYCKYIEPFAGSACLFFSEAPSVGVLGDLNQNLMDMYRAVAQDAPLVASRLSSLPTGSEAYYIIRSRFLTETDPITKAAIFVYLNRFCFNGLYRTNLKGQFNVPYGAPRSAAVPTLSDLVSASKHLSAATLLCGDFESVVRDNVGPGDFVYLDPPFYVSEQRVFRQYTATPFALQDFDRLMVLLDDIDAVGAKFLISYAYSEDAEKALQGYHIRTVTTRRNISGFPQHRAAAIELIASNYINQDE